MKLVSIIDKIKKVKHLEFDSDVAKSLGLSRTALAERKRRNRIPFEELIRFAEKESISIDWLLTEDKQTKYPPSPEESDSLKVDIYTLAGSASLHSLIEPQPIETIYLHRELIEENVVAVRIKDDSMVPGINNGAIVGIDKENINLRSGKIYAVWMDYEGAVIKRVFMEPERILLKSDNPLFPVYHKSTKELSEKFILGKVKWVIQNL